MTHQGDYWREEILGVGGLEIVLLPGIGGRVWDIRICGRSLLFQNPDLIMANPDLGRIAELPTRAPQYPFPLWGGEKTWIAPQSAWPNGAPHALLDSGPYRLARSGNQATMISERCPDTGLRICRTVTVHDDKRFEIHHTLHNEGAAPVIAVPWSVMMVRRPLIVCFEMSSTNEITHSFGDAGANLHQRESRVDIHCGDMQEFKLGARLAGNRCCFTSQGHTIRAEAFGPSGDAPVGHKPFEVYNSGAYDYGEVEWLGAESLLAPGQTAEIRVVFTCLDDRDCATGVEHWDEEDKPNGT